MHHGVDRVVVVGKIIIDEYRRPGQPMDETLISVGGGGPQAAFGAAAALAYLSDNEEGDDRDDETKGITKGSESPSLTEEKAQGGRRQPVTLIGAVGEQDWTDAEETALRSSLGDTVDSIQLVKVPMLKTPRIQLWHDNEQNVQWKALNDSFGDEGANSLWAGRPSAGDILSLLEPMNASSEKSVPPNVICHAVLEGGNQSPGKGMDSEFLLDDRLQSIVRFWGAEPVVFPGDDGIVADDDVASSMERLDNIAKIVGLLSPDGQLFRAIPPEFWSSFDVAVRLGPDGSKVLSKSGVDPECIVPVARLVTSDGQPINPTGAGNAYAAALTTCRGAGLSLRDAAVVASAVGAVICEYDHIPPWTPAVLGRIREAVEDIQSKLEK